MAVSKALSLTGIILDAASDLLAEIKANRDSISLNDADELTHRVREAEGWLLSIRRELQR